MHIQHPIYDHGQLLRQFFYHFLAGYVGTRVFPYTLGKQVFMVLQQLRKLSKALVGSA